MNLFTRTFLLLGICCPASYLAAQSNPPAGTYGFLVYSSFSNQAVNSTGVAILGVMNFDGSGNLTGTYTYEVDANRPQAAKTTNGNFTGSYSANADGTGSLAMTLDSGITLTLAMAAGDGGQSIQLVATDYRFPAAICACNIGRVVLAGTARSAPAAPLSSGVYAFQFFNFPNVNASVGVATLDGAGNMTISLTFVSASDADGQPAQPFSFSQTGTYATNPDGTGTFSLAAIPGVSNAQTYAFVSTDNGSALMLMQLDRAGNGLTFGMARRQ